jgi:hypothetical protein
LQSSTARYNVAACSIAGSSPGSVTFAPGATTQTFEIDTNANGLPKGQHVTADITAFYAEPTDPVPLRIVHK